MSLFSLVVLVIFIAACTAPPAPEATGVPTMAAMAVNAPARLYLPLAGGGPAPVQGWAKAYSSLSDADMQRLGIDWYYDYALRWPAPSQAGAQYVPFLWCDIYPALAYDAPVIRYFDSLRALPAEYSGYLLFLNEPDLRGSTRDGGQCERTPRQAAYMLRAAREICPGCIIVGPAASHEDYLAGWPWLRQFYDEVARIGVRPPDIAAIHDYTGQQPGAIVDSLFGLLAAYPGAPKTAWVTEFTAVAPAQLQRAIDYYRQDPRIERHAYFTARGWRAETDLIGANGQLTAVGEVYAGSVLPAYP